MVNRAEQSNPWYNKKNVNRLLLSVILASMFLFINAQEEYWFSHPKWGVRAGISASVPHLSSFNIYGFDVVDSQATGKVGTFVSVAMRLNHNRFFLQPEVGYSYMYGGTSFNLLQDEVEYPRQFVSFKNHSLDVPLFFGYNFIQRHPYVMSVYLGPQFRYNFSSEYYYNYSSVEASEEPCKFNIVVGLSAHIGRLLLEFRYCVDPLETSVTNYDIYIDKEQPQAAAGYKQRINTMGFAVGYYF